LLLKVTSNFLAIGKQINVIHSSDSIQINKTLGEGEFGVVQQGLWTTETGEKVGNSCQLE
jgi:hypothetical protein